MGDARNLKSGTDLSWAGVYTVLEDKDRDPLQKKDSASNVKRKISSRTLPIKMHLHNIHLVSSPVYFFQSCDIYEEYFPQIYTKFVYICDIFLSISVDTEYLSILRPYISHIYNYIVMNSFVEFFYRFPLLNDQYIYI